MGGNCCRKLVIFSLEAADSLEELLVDGCQRSGPGKTEAEKAVGWICYAPRLSR